MVNCPAEWANHALQTIRTVDPDTPLCVSHGGGGLETADPAWWKEKTAIDFYTYHLYPQGTTAPEMDYGLAASVLTRYGRIGKPAFLGESAGDQFSFGPDRETRRWTMRDLIWFSLVNGNPGCFFWNARGSELAEFKLAAEVAGRIDWSTLCRKRPAIAVRVPHPLDDDRWFRTPLGRAALAMLARYGRHYLDRGVDFDIVLGEASSYAAVAGVDVWRRWSPPRRSSGFRPAFNWCCCCGPATRKPCCTCGILPACSSGNRPSRNPGGSTSASGCFAALRVAVNLPGPWQADVWDLDTARH